VHSLDQTKRDQLAPVTLTLTRWPLYTNFTRISSRYIGCANMNFLRQGCKTWSFDRQTDRQIDRQTRPKIYTTSRVVNKMQLVLITKEVAYGLSIGNKIGDLEW